MGQVTLISGRERRRHWSSEERARILAAISAPGAVVAEVARREDVSTSLVYKWRREARKAEIAPGFAPVVIEAAPPAPAASRALGERRRGRRHHGGAQRSSRSHLRKCADDVGSGDLESAAA